MAGASGKDRAIVGVISPGAGPAGAETVVGDLKHRASLDDACRGVKTVISTVSVIVTAQPGDSFQSTDAQGTKSLIDAAKAAGVEHFIFISFDFDQFPESPLTDAKKEVEAYLRSGVIDYTILQPPPFMDVWLGPMMFGDPSAGQVKVYGSGTGKVAYVSTADVAAIAVNAVYSPAARNKTIKFTGPELISQRDAVREFETAVGKPLIVTEVPEQVLEVQPLLLGHAPRDLLVEPHHGHPELAVPGQRFARASGLGTGACVRRVWAGRGNHHAAYFETHASGRGAGSDRIE